METGAPHARHDKKPAALPKQLIRHSLKYSGSHRFCSNFNSLLDLTMCYSGNGTIFNDTKDAMQAVSWTQNGIFTSHSPSKLLNNAVVHCEGVEHGFGVARVGYGLCKIMDDDGDVIIADIP